MATLSLSTAESAIKAKEDLAKIKQLYESVYDFYKTMLCYQCGKALSSCFRFQKSCEHMICMKCSLCTCGKVIDKATDLKLIFNFTCDRVLPLKFEPVDTFIQNHSKPSEVTSLIPLLEKLDADIKKQTSKKN
jgi:hypothetical protein